MQDQYFSLTCPVFFFTTRLFKSVWWSLTIPWTHGRRDEGCFRNNVGGCHLNFAFVFLFWLKGTTWTYSIKIVTCHLFHPWHLLFFLEIQGHLPVPRPSSFVTFLCIVLLICVHLLPSFLSSFLCHNRHLTTPPQYIYKPNTMVYLWLKLW